MQSYNYQQIRQLQQQGDIALAIAHCQAALKYEADNLSLLALLGTLLCQQEDNAVISPILEQLLSRRAEFDAGLHTDLAGIYILLGEPANALEHVNAALAQDASCLLATLRRGLVCLQTGYYPQALADFTLGLTTLPPEQHLGLHINLARCHVNQGDTDAALPHIHTAYTLGGGGRPAWLCVAVDCYIARHDTEQAEVALQNSIAAGVDELLTTKVKALLLAAQNKHDEAEQQLKTCLQKHPKHLELFTQLANIATFKGRYGAALGYLQRAINIDPVNPELWIHQAQLGRLCLPVHAVREAATTALTLTSTMIGQRRAEALVIMAHAEADAEQYAAAESYYQQALQQLPDYVPATLGLGYLWLQWGRIDAAIAVFEAASSYDLLASYSALTHTKRFPNNPVLLEKIERVANLPSIQGPVASGLLFDLAAAWEQRQDYHRAFQIIQQANHAVRQQITYVSQTHRDYCIRLMHVFSRDFFADRHAYGHASCLPLFIVGMPRSGTTLVEQLLGGHPDIFVAGEIGLLSETLQKLIAWEQHLGSGITYPECLFDLTAEQANAYGEQILTDCRHYHGTARYIVDKLPHNFENIGLIRLLFPHAKIIHVQREPRDIAVSTFFTHFQAHHAGMGYAYALSDIARHLVDYQQLMHHWDNTLAEPLLTLTYENIVDDTEAAVRNLLTYLDLDWTPAVLKHQHRTRAVKTASIWQVRQPVYQTSKQKWRRYAAFLEPFEATFKAPVPEFTAPGTGFKQAQLPPGLFFSGMDLLQKTDYEAAALCFERILTHHPNHAAANHMLGLALLKQGKLSAALPLLETSIKLQPNHPEWQENLQICYQQLTKTAGTN